MSIHSKRDAAKLGENYTINMRVDLPIYIYICILDHTLCYITNIVICVLNAQTIDVRSSGRIPLVFLIPTAERRCDVDNLETKWLHNRNHVDGSDGMDMTTMANNDHDEEEDDDDDDDDDGDDDDDDDDDGHDDDDDHHHHHHDHDGDDEKMNMITGRCCLMLI